MTTWTVPSEYSHFGPLFDQLSCLAPTDPVRDELRDKLIAGHLPLVKNIARRYRGKGEPLEDLEQAGALALVRAVDRFEPKRGVEFIAFAIPSITGELKRHFRDRTWSLRVPRRMKELQSAIHAEAGRMSQQLGRAPRPTEIATRLEVTVEEVIDALAAGEAHHSRSLDELLGEDSNAPSLADTMSQIDTAFDAVEHREALAPLLDALPSRERTILLLRFFGGMTQTQIAGKIGISQMHVSRLLAATMTQLRVQLLQE